MGRGQNKSKAVSNTRGSSEIADELQKILSSDKLKGLDVAWVSLIGSRAYGLSRPDSDVDLRGFYLPRVPEYLGIKPIQENIDFKESDTVIYEIRKFIKMASAANPNILEVLWGEPLSLSREGKILQENRSMFLAESTVKTAYIGFIISQLKRAEKSTREKERSKASLHLYRQVDNAEDLLTTGSMSLRVKDPERLKESASQDMKSIAEDINTKIEKIRSISSALPEQPDYDRINQFLIDIQLNRL